MGGLLLWPGLGSPIGKLSRRGLKILGALVEGNSLEGLYKKNWLLGMGDLSITCGLYSLLGCIRVLAFTRLSRTKRLAFFGWILGPKPWKKLMRLKTHVSYEHGLNARSAPRSLGFRA